MSKIYKIYNGSGTSFENLGFFFLSTATEIEFILERHLGFSTLPWLHIVRDLGGIVVVNISHCLCSFTLHVPILPSVFFAVIQQGKSPYQGCDIPHTNCVVAVRAETWKKGNTT